MENQDFRLAVSFTWGKWWGRDNMSADGEKSFMEEAAFYQLGVRAAFRDCPVHPAGGDLHPDRGSVQLTSL